MKQFRAFLDKVIQTAGNGVLGTISAINGSTFTMAIPAGAGAGIRGPDNPDLRFDADNKPQRCGERRLQRYRGRSDFRDANNHCRQRASGHGRQRRHRA